MGSKGEELENKKWRNKIKVQQQQKSKGELSQGARYNKDMVKLMTQKLEQDSTLKIYKFQDLNSTEQERHPLEVTQLERQNKVPRLLKYQNLSNLDSNSRVLRERKPESESQKLRKKISPILTLNMQRRVKKQGKYSSLETLTMRMLKQKGIYAQSKALAKANGIGEQKNYCIIALRLGLLYHHKTIIMGMSKRRAVQLIHESLVKRLEECLNKKYINSNSDSFVELVKIKNMRDILVFKKALQSPLKNFESVFSIIQGLYDKKNDGCPSLKNQGFCQKVTRILMGTAVQGPSFGMGFQRKQIDLLDEVQFPRKVVEKTVEMSQYIEESMVENFLQLPPLDVCRQKPVDSEDIFDLICPFYLNTFARKEMSTVPDLQYYPFYNQNIFLQE